ncbi:MAG: hypothetical protein GX857_10980 [Bacteroidales bacterium]|jgi:hypothetical protein|nr:hypothetical protein [Bacteroidales bacterium]
MKIKELDKREITDSNKGLITAFSQFDNLLTELKKMELPEDIAFTINIEIEKINGVTDSDKMLRKQIRSSQTSIIKLIEKQLKLVTRNYYRNTWMVLGMAAFGIPLGAAYGSITGNMAFISIGLPIGMVLGMAIGAGMDKKALKEGRQLDIEIKN